ncbi:MAG: hypothetical protein E5Y79_16070 [Mesorhizobium sp.]|uniref:DUF6074 family protein n=1 Tax=Mesorhizobium sp. TaxID=1871066 RepID=UPI0012030692|nr:DUF6074 family protein [Mesorhizobium sp.]TIL59251.1 MAG: hypothetical protein E5Y79_16070 [Mesorhizobium sp.]
MKQLDFHSLLTTKRQPADIILFPAKAQRALARAAAARIEALPISKRKLAWYREVRSVFQQQQVRHIGEAAARSHQCEFAMLLNEEIKRLQVIAQLHGNGST